MAITWTTTDAAGSVKAACTAMTESLPTGSSDGCPLGDAAALDLFVEADSGQTITTAGPLICAVRNRITGTWCRFPEWDLTAQSAFATRQGGTYLGTSAGKGFILASRAFDRIAWVPNGTWVVSSGGLNVYINRCMAAGK